MREKMESREGEIIASGELSTAEIETLKSDMHFLEARKHVRFEETPVGLKVYATTKFGYTLFSHDLQQGMLSTRGWNSKLILT